MERRGRLQVLLNVTPRERQSRVPLPPSSAQAGSGGWVYVCARVKNSPRLFPRPLSPSHSGGISVPPPRCRSRAARPVCAGLRSAGRGLSADRAGPDRTRRGGGGLGGAAAPRGRESGPRRRSAFCGRPLYFPGRPWLGAVGSLSV